jgi:Rab5 GDP/GTP exchange factor
MGAIQFIENMDRTTLTISDEEFEKSVEAAVSAIAEKHRSESPPPAPPLSEKPAPTLQPSAVIGESSSTRPSMDSDAQLRPGTPRASTSSDRPEDEKAAISSLLQTIQKPLSTIGRMFSDEPPSPSTSGSAGPSRSPAHTPQPSADHQRKALSAEDAAARQASAEVAEAQRLHRAEHANIVETLAGMFPDLDRDIISDVVYQKEGRQVFSSPSWDHRLTNHHRVGMAVDACLALSS